jgi:hypothetical protein
MCHGLPSLGERASDAAEIVWNLTSAGAARSG